MINMINFENFYQFTSNSYVLILIALICNIGITIFRTKRILLLSKHKKIIDLILFFSFYRLSNFILPFKSADILKLFFFKKILKKNKNKNIFSVYLSTKILDLFLFIFLSLLILLFFAFVKFNIVYFIFFLILIILLITRNKKKIFLSIKKFKNTIRYLSKSYTLTKKLFNEFDYIAKEKFFERTINISIFNYIFTLIIMYLSTDRSLDREIFFLVFIFSILQPLPLKLFFGVGFFDIVVYITNIYFNIGINLEQLILFRSLIFSLLFFEFILILVYYFVQNYKNVLFKKY